MLNVTIWGFIYLVVGILLLALDKRILGLGTLGVALIIVDLAFIIAGLIMIFSSYDQRV